MNNQETPDSAKKAELIYSLNQRPPIGEAIFAALQHLMAIVVSIMTPALIICAALGADVADTTYIVSMSLLVSGVATFIQIRRIGPVGSGLLSIQGTSFAFIGVLILAGKDHLSAGNSLTATFALLFGLCFVGSFIEMICSRFIRPLRLLITPLVSGIVVTLIGTTLIGSAIQSCAGGVPQLSAFKAGQIGAEAIQKNLLLALFVVIVIIALNVSRNKWLRMSSIFVGIVSGYLISVFLGLVDFSNFAKLDYFAVPVPFKYGFSFSLKAFVGIAILYLVTLVETIGDITATSMVSGEPIEGEKYVERISGGVLGDGFNSMLAAIFNTFPNTTFSQNNGIIQLTGVASRYVGYFVAGILVLLGVSPLLSGLAAIMPAPVLGGATLLMFGTVASSGIRIIASQHLDRRGLLVLAISLGTGLGVSFEPMIVKALPLWLQGVMNSGIIAGGLTAIIVNWVLPGDTEKYVGENPPEVGPDILELDEE